MGETIESAYQLMRDMITACEVQVYEMMCIDALYNNGYSNYDDII